jgi:uncharacterized protein YndB with AHSA1/START domain
VTEIRTVVVEREMPHPPERVWRALTTPHLMAEWLGMRADFAPEPGRPLTLTGEWGAVEGEVLEAEAPHRLSYRWDHPNPEAAYDLRSVVTFTLTPTARGTLVRMEQVGFRPDQRQALGGALHGWRAHLERLESVTALLPPS